MIAHRARRMTLQVARHAVTFVTTPSRSHDRGQARVCAALQTLRQVSLAFSGYSKQPPLPMPFRQKDEL